MEERSIHNTFKFFIRHCSSLKGTVPRDFRLLFFFMNRFPPSPWVYQKSRFEFFRKFAEIFAAQGAPPVSLIPVVHLDLRLLYLREFSKKFETVLMQYSGAGGKLIHQKTQKQNISWHCPFKYVHKLWPRFLSTWLCFPALEWHPVSQQFLEKKLNTIIILVRILLSINTKTGKLEVEHVSERLLEF